MIKLVAVGKLCQGWIENHAELQYSVDAADCRFAQSG
jgi:hypothetical protein